MGKKITCMLLLFLVTFLQLPVWANAEEPYKLYFSEKNGKLYYKNKSEDTNLFLNLNDMFPGQKYTSDLNIRNEANKTYDLYFQMIPKAGSLSESLELLSQIEITIYNKNKQIYKGKADKSYPAKEGRLIKSEMIYLGNYTPKESHNLKVEVMLDEDYWGECETRTSYYLMDEHGEYSKKVNDKPAGGKYKIVSASVNEFGNRSAETTWEFYAEETSDEEEIPNIPDQPSKDPDNLKPVKPAPKTGDMEWNIFKIGLAMSISLLIIILISKPYKRRQQ